MNFTIEHEREEDGRWLAEVPELPGVLAYGADAEEAMVKAEALALRVIAERLKHYLFQFFLVRGRRMTFLSSRTISGIDPTPIQATH